MRGKYSWLVAVSSFFVLQAVPGYAPARDGWEADRRLTVDPAASRTAINFARSTAVDRRGRLHVVWEDTRDGVEQVYYLRSSPGGESWEPPRRLSVGGAKSLQPAVAVSGVRVYAVWHQIDASGTHVHFARSADRGRSWSSPAPLSLGTQGGAHASLAATADRVHAIWGGAVGVHAEISTRRSLDGGATWLPVERLSEVPFESWVPSIVAERDRVVAAWVDYQDANEEEYLRISTDGGASWGAITRLTFDEADSWAPSAAVAGNVIHVTWFDRRAARVSDADVERALDRALELVGLDPAPPPPRDASVYYLPGFTRRVAEKKAQLIEAAPAWVAAGKDPKQRERRFERHVRRFERLEKRWARGWEIFYKRSDDGGHDWTPDRRLTRARGASARPSLAVDGQELFVVWYDQRDGNDEIYYKASTDSGVSWGPDTRLTRAAGSSIHPTVALSEAHVHVVWSDEREGVSQIYAKRKLRAR